jgi:deoxyadenosine/deoxycytidine kinase
VFTLQNNTKEPIIYLISGPIGVGKSTVTKQLAQKVESCALIEADHLLHMFQGKAGPSWEERLHITWLNIVAVTRNYSKQNVNVMIDFVVEDEFEWFCNELSDLNVRIVYVVLRADEETMLKRLNQRGDHDDSIKRSLFLLNKLEKAPTNAPFLFDTTNKQPADIAEEIIKDARFHVYLH